MALSRGVLMNQLDSYEEQEREAADESKLVKTCTNKVYALVSGNVGAVGGLDVAAGVCGINAGDLRSSTRWRS
jgi:hypothetical protein